MTDKTSVSSSEQKACADVRFSDIEAPWTVIDSYFQDKHLERLVRHQLESYNHFVGYQIMKTIEMFNPVNIKSENDYDPKSGHYALEIFITFENFNIYHKEFSHRVFNLKISIKIIYTKTSYIHGPKSVVRFPLNLILGAKSRLRAKIMSFFQVRYLGEN